MSLITPALPKGSLILVTGANGYIGSHVVDQLLRLGYNVRGTIRNEKPWIEILFSKRCREHGSSAGVFEAVVIEDIAKQGAFNHIIEGVSGIVHVAADLSFDTNAEKVISFAVAANINILSVAAANDTIKRVVLTSSSTACNIAKPFEPTVVITHDTWNDEITYLIKTMPTNMPDTIKGYLIYAASKTASEQQAWKYMEEKKPGFVLNTIVPSMNLGTILDSENISSSGGIFRKIYTESNNTWRFLESQYHVNVVDCARLHVAALLTPSIKSQRLFAYEAVWTQTGILSILRKLKPDFEWPDPVENELRDRSQVPESKDAEKAIINFFGVPGWTTIEESLEELCICRFILGILGTKSL